MSDFTRVQHASASPTSCLLCGTHQGPFIDTKVDLYGYGWVYICAGHEGRSGCARQLGRRDGMQEPDTVETLILLAEEIERLQAELERERGKKTVTIAEVREALHPSAAG